GFTLTPRILVVVLIVFFPVLVSTVSAVDAVDGELVDLVASMGASRRQVLRTVLAPAAVPGFFAGFRIAATYAIGGAVVAELVGGNGGLGFLLLDARKNYLVDRMIAIVAVVALLTAVLFVLVGVAERFAAPWQAVDTSPGPFARSRRGAVADASPMTRIMR
ncbi:MAG TPA: ABC transporter permease subunit, partial [Acidimicrobiales bacterium]